MFACLDVDYRDDDVTAVTACLVFDRWTDAEALHELTVVRHDVAPYVPGAFYRRELPCLTDALSHVDLPLDAIIIDGHTWLGPKRPGLGVHLYDALEQRTPVIGVAKKGFMGLQRAKEVRRGDSDKPLYVTAIGTDPAKAARDVARMHGPFRIPTLLKRVDRLARDHVLGGATRP